MLGLGWSLACPFVLVFLSCPREAVASENSWSNSHQRRRLSGIPKSAAIVGSTTVVRPLSSVLMPVIRVTAAITAAVWVFDSTAVTTRSRLCKFTSSRSYSWDPMAMVDGRRMLLAAAATASGRAIVCSSIEVLDMMEIRQMRDDHVKQTQARAGESGVHCKRHLMMLGRNIGAPRNCPVHGSLHLPHPAL
jgi:hypothetical protein